MQKLASAEQTKAWNIQMPRYAGANSNQNAYGQQRHASELLV